MTCCPICLNENFKTLAEFGEIPRSDCYLESKNMIPDTIRLDFEYCNKCAFIRQKEFQEHNYKEDTRNTNHTLMDYCYDIVDRFKSIKQELIVDVGCNDGAFLDILYNKGMKNLLGVEPSVSCSDLCKSKGYRVSNDFFNRESVIKLKKEYGNASVIIYRHVLEHVKEPFNFLLYARDFLKENGMLFIELPDSNNIIYGLNAHELLDQHFSYFTPKNLEMIVDRAGFKVRNIFVKPYMGTDAILLLANKNSHKTTLKKSEFDKDVQNCSIFSENWEKISERLNALVKNLKKPITALGASHPQSRFLIFSGLGNQINQLVDDDPRKIGRYVCIPNPVQIISTEEFIKNPSMSILDTAFGHSDWAEGIEKQSGLPMLKFKKRLSESC